jgi:hypothetical protein
MKNKVKSACAKAVQFAEITKNLIRSGNVPRVRKCLGAAEKLLYNGSAETKSVIANIYVFSVSTFIEIHHHYKVSQLLPECLLKEYRKQIYAQGT